jgi:hypothetical protein
MSTASPTPSRLARPCVPLTGQTLAGRTDEVIGAGAVRCPAVRPSGCPAVRTEREHRAGAGRRSGQQYFASGANSVGTEVALS